MPDARSEISTPRAGWESDRGRARGTDAPRVSQAIITPSLYLQPNTVVPVTYGVLRRGRRGGGWTSDFSLASRGADFGSARATRGWRPRGRSNASTRRADARKYYVGRRYSLRVRDRTGGDAERPPDAVRPHVRDGSLMVRVLRVVGGIDARRHHAGADDGVVADARGDHLRGVVEVVDCAEPRSRPVGVRVVCATSTSFSRGDEPASAHRNCPSRVLFGVTWHILPRGSPASRRASRPGGSDGDRRGGALRVPDPRGLVAQSRGAGALRQTRGHVLRAKSAPGRRPVAGGVGVSSSWAREDDGTSGGELSAPWSSSSCAPRTSPVRSVAPPPRPSPPPRARTRAAGPRMLRLELTDGDAVVVGVEHAPSSPPLRRLPRPRGETRPRPGRPRRAPPRPPPLQRRPTSTHRRSRPRARGDVGTTTRVRGIRRGSEAEAMKLSGAPEFRTSTPKRRRRWRARRRPRRTGAQGRHRRSRRSRSARLRRLPRLRPQPRRGFDRRAGERERAGGVRTAAATRASPDPRATRSRRRRGRSPGAGTTARPPRVISSDAEPAPAPAFSRDGDPRFLPDEATARRAPAAPIRAERFARIRTRDRERPPSARTRTPRPRRLRSTATRNARGFSIGCRRRRARRSSTIPADEEGAEGVEGPRGVEGGEAAAIARNPDRRVTSNNTRRARRAGDGGGRRGVGAAASARADLEHRGGDSDDAGAALAASLYRFDAREVVGEEDEGRRGGRGGGGRGRGRGRR